MSQETLNMLATYGPFVLIIVMFWFVIRSQKKREKETQNMRQSVAIGDKVTTIGGIVGKVINVTDDKFELETGSDKTHMTFVKAAIGTIDEKADSKQDN